MARAGAIALGACLAAWSADARADERADEPEGAESAADSLFQEGRALLEAGRFAEAVPKFVESQKLDPGVGTLLNIAYCEEQLSRTASAWTAYLEAAAAAHERGELERERIARARAAALEPLVPKVTVAVAAQSGDVEILVDGVPLPRASWGAPVPVDAGLHHVEAQVEARQSWSARVEVDATHQPVVMVPVLDASTTVSGPRPAAADAHAPPDVRSERRWRLPTVVALGATGVAGLALGSAFAVSAKARYDDSRNPALCNSQNRCTPAGQDERRTAFAYADVASGAIAAGAVLLGGAGVLWLTTPKAADPAGRAVIVAPMIATCAWGLTLAGRW